MDYQLAIQAEDQHDIDAGHNHRIILANKLLNVGMICCEGRKLTTNDLKEYFDLYKFELLPIDYLLTPFQQIDDKNDEKFIIQSKELVKQAAYGLVAQECIDLGEWA